MRLIRIPNPRLSTNEKTYLDADYTAGGITLTSVNNAGFALNDYAVCGEIGEEKTEQILVTSITGATIININTGGYSFNHNKTTSIYRSRWNQISLERMPTGGVWSEISAMVIQWDKLETLYQDNSGDDTYSYRFRFKNSQLQIFSEYSPTVQGSGFTNLQVGQMIMNVRRKIRDPNRQRYTDTDIINLLQQAQQDIQMRVPKLWFLMVDTFETGTGITATAGTKVYSLSSYSDFLYLSKMRYNYILGGNNLLWDLEPLPDIEFDRYTYNQLQVTDDNVRRIKLLPPTTLNLQGSFKVYPTPKTTGVGIFYPVYYRKFTILNDISDKTDLPFPEILEDYASWRLHQLMGNKLQAEIYKKLYSGPDSGTRSEPLTGIALLIEHNKAVMQTSMGYGKQLWRYRGRKGRANFFGHGIASRDYIKENYM